MAKKDFMTLMKEKTTDVRPSLLSSEEAIKRQIVILDRLRELIPPLTVDELVQLEQNVLKHGIKDPLTIWETTNQVAGLGEDQEPAFILVDGHNRYSISQQHSLDFRINIVRFNSLDEVTDYMIDYQLGRRNLTKEQASYLRGLKYNKQKAIKGSNLGSSAVQINVAETLADEYGVSSRTIKRDGEFATGIDRLAPELKRSVLAGKQKVPKSALATLAKHEVGSLTEEGKVEPIATLQALKANKHSNKEAENASGDSLILEIRRLANGELTKPSCVKLIKKINEFLDSKRSK